MTVSNPAINENPLVSARRHSLNSSSSSSSSSSSRLMKIPSSLRSGKASRAGGSSASMPSAHEVLNNNEKHRYYDNNESVNLEYHRKPEKLLSQKLNSPYRRRFPSYYQQHDPKKIKDGYEKRKRDRKRTHSRSPSHLSHASRSRSADSSSRRLTQPSFRKNPSSSPVRYQSRSDSYHSSSSRYDNDRYDDYRYPEFVAKEHSNRKRTRNDREEDDSDRKSSHEWWDRTDDCKDAKSDHVERVDALCDYSREQLVLDTTLWKEDPALEPNMFPYLTPEGIEHYTLWSKYEMTKEEVVEFVDHWLEIHMPQVRRWNYDDNLGERSIELFHVHVFIETIPYSFTVEEGKEYIPPHMTAEDQHLH